MTMRNRTRWNVPSTITPSPALQTAVGGHPLAARSLAQRGYTTPQAAQAFLDPAAYLPTPPQALPDLSVAVEHLSHALTREQRILVWGDFDVDGQTATALLVDALQGLGADVVYYIPHRLRESHGILPDSLKTQIDATEPAILLTCDTGVAALEALDYAKSRGLTALVTDHHDLPPELPSADAIVNPKRLPSEHPLASLPGVGVAYKLVQALYTRLDRAGDLPRFLDLVALGIVADVARQTHDTRYLLQLGLERLRRTERTGLQALIEVAQLDPERLTVTDIGFQLGPRLNAAGRLADANPVVELLTTADRARALLLAQNLEALNGQRRLQSRQIIAAAQEQIARDPSLLDWEALVLDHPAWHPGVIGIVASRLAEQYQRPVVLLTTTDTDRARGSARSVPGYDIGAAIAAQADLLLTYGGHPGAAGLSLHPDNIPAFRRRLSETLRATRDPSAQPGVQSAQPGVQIDAYLDFGELTLDLARELNRLAPFGEGNPPVTLATRELTLASAAVIGRTQEHRRLTVQDATGNRQTVLWWNSADRPLPAGIFDLAYHLEISTFRGETEYQLVLVDWRRSPTAPVEVAPPRLEVLDHRHNPAPDRQLAQLLAHHPDVAVWAEGYRRAESPGLPLGDLPESAVLVVYTVPPGPQALQQALERVKPAQVVLLAVAPPLTTFTDVLRRTWELANFVINRQDGRTTLSALAGAVAQLPGTIRLALAYTEARGEIDIDYGRGDRVALTRTERAPTPDVDQYLAALQTAIAETAAYRAYFRRAAASRLLPDQEVTP